MLQFLSEEINSFKKIEKGRKTVSTLKEATVLLFKHDECVTAILADIANKSRVQNNTKRKD